MDKKINIPQPYQVVNQKIQAQPWLPFLRSLGCCGEGNQSHEATPGGRERSWRSQEELCGGTEKGMRVRVMFAQGEGQESSSEALWKFVISECGWSGELQSRLKANKWLRPWVQAALVTECGADSFPGPKVTG